MRVFRIGAAVFTRTRKEAFSGQGGVYASARWHSAGRPIVYTAQSLSLAALEILVRLKQTNDIQPFYAYSMEIPDHLILTPKSLPVRWKSRIAVSRALGDAWLKTNNSPALRVPTVITPGEWNVLVNPLHPQFSLKWIGTRHDPFQRELRMEGIHENIPFAGSNHGRHTQCRQIVRLEPCIAKCSTYRDPTPPTCRQRLGRQNETVRDF